MDDTTAQLVDRNPFSPEAMSAVARLVSTEAERDAVAPPAARLAADGYAVLPDLIVGDELRAVGESLDELLAVTRPVDSSFAGSRTTRVFNMLGRSRAFDGIARHPKVIALVESHLADQIQVSEMSSVSIGPGEPEQILHFDDGCYPLPRPHPPLMVSVMWAIDDFTLDNGATHLVRGSHLEVEPPVTATDTDRLVMTAGSAGLWDGRLVHGAGANTTDRERRAIVVLYARAWLRQQENQYLCVDHETVATLDPDYQHLLGWSRYGPHTGIVDGRDPRRVLPRSE